MAIKSDDPRVTERLGILNSIGLVQSMLTNPSFENDAWVRKHANEMLKDIRQELEDITELITK